MFPSEVQHREAGWSAPASPEEHSRASPPALSPSRAGGGGERGDFFRPFAAGDWTRRLGRGRRLGKAETSPKGGDDKPLPPPALQEGSGSSDCCLQKEPSCRPASTSLSGAREQLGLPPPEGSEIFERGGVRERTGLCLHPGGKRS